MEQSVYKVLENGRSIFYGWGTAMNTRVDVILCHRPQAECEAATGRIIDELQRLEGRLSKFDADSDISRINRLAATEPVPVDEEIYGILVSALRYGAMTGFAFDITYASPKGEPGNRIHLDPGKKIVLFKTKGVQIDLGGYGKGYGLEKIQDMLQAEGWTDFLINFGNSSVCARGNRPGGSGWSIGIENQHRQGTNALEIVLHNQSLNTSGNTGQHHRHIYSAGKDEFIGGLGSVSVVTPGPLEGEILSTALFSALHNDPGQPPACLKNFPDARAYEVTYTQGTHVVKVLI